MSSRLYLRITITRAGDRLHIKGYGNEGQSPSSYEMPNLTVTQLEDFATKVRLAAKSGRALGEELGLASSLYQDLFREGINNVMQQHYGANLNEPVLVHLDFDKSDRLLHAVPWEAACAPDSHSTFLANSADVLVARNVSTDARALIREVKGPLHILGIALHGSAAVTRLQTALEERIQSGEVHFEPLVGLQACIPALRARLARAPFPHVLHFVCHGRINDESKQPQLELMSDVGDPDWRDVEFLVQEILSQRELLAHLRLIVLDACEGANPGVLASAAELLARKAAVAVVAHLWPVRADVTQTCSETFYQSLARAEAPLGDVAVSLNDARREVLGRNNNSAEGFSPVLYLRGQNSALFDFRGRRIIRLSSEPQLPGLPEPSRALETLLGKRFSLVLGDRWSNERDVRKVFREALCQELAMKLGPLPAGVPLSTLSQHFALLLDEQRVRFLFFDAFDKIESSPPMIAKLAQRLPPGVHVTLLRYPTLEVALTEHQPDVTIHVITPPERLGGTVTLRRWDPGPREWVNVSAASRPRSLYPDQDIIVLRLYSGYVPPRSYLPPRLTEDDYFLGCDDLRRMLTGDVLSASVVNELLGEMGRHPALILGMSMLYWQHRMLLHRLFGTRPLPEDSLVLLEKGEHEREIWEAGRNLPWKVGLQVLELSTPELPASPGANPPRERA
ncbi:CHAT domain-containing protein [Pyxidicoccus sp. 3LG]